MTLVEIEYKIADYIKRRDGLGIEGLSINDIKRKIELYCDYRDRNAELNNARATPRDQYCEYRPYVIREGVQIMRDKIK